MSFHARHDLLHNRWEGHCALRLQSVFPNSMAGATACKNSQQDECNSDSLLIEIHVSGPPLHNKRGHDLFGYAHGKAEVPIMKPKSVALWLVRHFLDIQSVQIGGDPNLRWRCHIPYRPSLPNHQTFTGDNRTRHPSQRATRRCTTNGWNSHLDLCQ